MHDLQSLKGLVNGTRALHEPEPAPLICEGTPPEKGLALPFPHTHRPHVCAQSTSTFIFVQKKYNTPLHALPLERLEWGKTGC